MSVVDCNLLARRASFSARLGPTPGRAQGHTAMQIAQPEVSAKKGMHLSKFTYHFSSPRTVFLSASIANGGQAFSQTRHLEQKSSIPNSLFGVDAIGASVKMAPRRNAEPNSGLMSEPCLPNSPKPQASAGGIMRILPTMGPVTGSASQPSVRSHPAIFFAAAAARPY